MKSYSQFIQYLSESSNKNSSYYRTIGNVGLGPGTGRVSKSDLHIDALGDRKFFDLQKKFTSAYNIDTAKLNMKSIADVFPTTLPKSELKKLRSQISNMIQSGASRENVLNFIQRTSQVFGNARTFNDSTSRFDGIKQTPNTFSDILGQNSLSRTDTQLTNFTPGPYGRWGNR